MADDQVEVGTDEQEHHGRDQEDMGRVKPGERLTTDGLPGDQQIGERLADEWKACGLLGYDNDRPVGILVPVEELAGKGHPKCQDQ